MGKQIWRIYMKYKMLKTSIVWGIIIVTLKIITITVTAEIEHTYTYNSQTGYEVPYTVVTKDALQEVRED